MCLLGTHVLREPAEALAVALAHDDGAHEDLDGADVPEGNLTLAGGLVEAELVTELLLGNGTGGVDLVAEDEERNVGELLDRDWEGESVSSLARMSCGRGRVCVGMQGGRTECAGLGVHRRQIRDRPRDGRDPKIR